MGINVLSLSDGMSCGQIAKNLVVEKMERRLKMEKEKCQKIELRDVNISIRITQSMSDFIKKEKLSPSMIMVNALEDLGYVKK